MIDSNLNRSVGYWRRLKFLLPKPIWNAGRRGRHYVQRLADWMDGMRYIRGRTDADQRVLCQSARRGLLAAHVELDTWQNPTVVDDVSVEVSGVGKFDVRAGTDDFYHLNPRREPAIFREIQRRIGPGSTFVDAGANIGFFTVLAGRLSDPSGRVIAIEMMPDTARLLRRNIELNCLCNVKVIELALSDHSGETVMASSPAGMFGQASIVTGHDGGVAVKTITIDEAIAVVPGTIDLMKVDLEGAEPKAFKGAGQILKRTRAVIVEQLGDDNTVVGLLANSGFSIRRLDPSNLIAERNF